MQQASGIRNQGTLSSLNLKMNKNIFFSGERVLQCDNQLKQLILLNKVLFQSCYNLFHSVTISRFPTRKNLFTFLKKLVFQNKNSMVEVCQEKDVKL